MASLNTPATGEVKETIKDLFTTKKFSDLGIYCRGKFWDVHQAIVCMRSTVIEEFCTKSGRQSQGKLHIDLSDYESEVLEAVLSFMYLDHYDAGEEAGVLFHTKVFIAACKFEMPGLKDLALVKYQDAVEIIGENWEKNFCMAAGILWRESVEGLGEAQLKNVVVAFAREMVVRLLESKGGEFRALGLERPDIGMAVLEAIVKSNQARPVEEVLDIGGVDTTEEGSGTRLPTIFTGYKVETHPNISPSASPTTEKKGPKTSSVFDEVLTPLYPFTGPEIKVLEPETCLIEERSSSFLQVGKKSKRCKCKCKRCQKCNFGHKSEEAPLDVVTEVEPNLDDCWGSATKR